MSLDLSIDGRIVSLVSSGLNDTDEVIQKLVDLYKSPEFPADPIMYWDLRSSTSLGKRTAAELETVASRTRPYTKNLPAHSVFLVSNDLYHGMARMMSAYGEANDDQVQIFRTEEDALEYLQNIQAS